MDFADYKSFSLQQLAERFRELQYELKESKAKSAEIQKEFDYLRKAVLPEKMEELGFDTVNITGVGRISLRAEIYASIIADQREAALTWLSENGHGALIKDTVNASSLKALMKEQIGLGEIFPEEIFNCTPYTMATLTKL